MKNKFNNISERSFICATKPINPRLRYMQKLLFQIFLIVCFMVYLKKYVNEHEKIYGIANIVFLSTAKYLIIVTRSKLYENRMCHDLFHHEM